MDHTSDLTLEEKVLFGVRHGMVPVEWGESEVEKMCEAVLPLSVAPIVGWTKGLHWVVYGSSANVRIYQGTKRFTAFIQSTGAGTDLKREMWVDPEFYPTIALFAQEIREDIFIQMGRLRVAGKEITEFVTTHQALKAESFPAWAAGRSKEVREDPLNQILFEKYQQEYQIAEAAFMATMRTIFLRHARTRGARYVSIGQSLFCVLEDVRTDGIQSQPVAHQIMVDLNLFAGGQESYGAKAMNLYALLGRDIEGIWFVDTDEPVKVHDMSLDHRQFEERMIMKGQGDLEMSEWLEACGAKKMPLFR